MIFTELAKIFSLKKSAMKNKYIHLVTKLVHLQNHTTKSNLIKLSIIN
jgi:hypothetical protein